LSTLKVGNFTKLEKVTEAGEIKALSTAEAKEGYSLETFGGIFSPSRKAIINDDLGAFARWGEMMGQAAAETEAGQLLALLSANAGAGVTMDDGKALFHADHGNLAGTGAALSEATLDAARQAMRTQKMMDGKTPVNVVPRFLVVRPARDGAKEFDGPGEKRFEPVVHDLKDWVQGNQTVARKKDDAKGGTMRLGAYSAVLTTRYSRNRSF